MEQVAALLTSKYGLDVAQIEPAPRGWTGETYVVTTHDGGRVFVKVYPEDRLPPTAAPALPVLVELHRIGLTQISRPIPTASGALYERLGDDLVVVFAYLDGARVPFTFDGEQFGDLIAKVHAQTARVVRPVVRETFEPQCGDELWRTLARARQEPATDEPRRGLRRFLEEQDQAITAAWAALGKIARACRAASFDLVLSHGDWPFNLLRNPDGTLYLIDWDELLLAPAERDTWFANAGPAFWHGYRARRGDHAKNALATAYYVHNRYFEDLLGAAQVILGDGTFERRTWALGLLGNNWMEGLRARMRKPGFWTDS